MVNFKIILTIILAKCFFTLICSASTSAHYVIYNRKEISSSLTNNSLVAVYTNLSRNFNCLLKCNQNVRCTVAVFIGSECRFYYIFSPFNENTVLVNSTGTTYAKKYSKINESCEIYDCLSPLGLICNSNKRCVCSSTSYCYGSVLMDTTILTNAEIAKVYEHGGYTSNRSFQLLYRGSRDGFAASNFHNKVDGNLNTLIIGLSNFGHVVAAFASQLWNGIYGYRTDSSIYFLSLRRNVTGFNVATDALKFFINESSKLIGVKSDWGPIFGSPEFFRIVPLSNTNTNSFVKLRESLHLPVGYTYGAIDPSAYPMGCSSIDAFGSCFYGILDFEVFKLI